MVGRFTRCPMSPASDPILRHGRSSLSVLIRGQMLSPAIYWLLYPGRVCLLPIFDANHRVWNDCQLALQHSRLWTLVQLMTIVLNLDHGPWQESRWVQEGREAVLSYTAVADTSCPVFESLYPGMLEDSGDSHRLAEEGLDRLIFRSLRSAFSQKQQKVSITRWFGIVEAVSLKYIIWCSEFHDCCSSCSHYYQRLRLCMFGQHSPTTEIPIVILIRSIIIILNGIAILILIIIIILFKILIIILFQCQILIICLIIIVILIIILIRCPIIFLITILLLNRIIIKVLIIIPI